MYICRKIKLLRNIPIDGSSNTRFKDSQSAKYCLASDLKSTMGSTCLKRGNLNGEEIEIVEGPFNKESGSHRHPGFPTKSTRSSLHNKINK